MISATPSSGGGYAAAQPWTARLLESPPQRHQVRHVHVDLVSRLLHNHVRSADGGAAASCRIDLRHALEDPAAVCECAVGRASGLERGMHTSGVRVALVLDLRTGQTRYAAEREGHPTSIAAQHSVSLPREKVVREGQIRRFRVLLNTYFDGSYELRNIRRFTDDLLFSLPCISLGPIAAARGFTFLSLRLAANLFCIILTEHNFRFRNPRGQRKRPSQNTLSIHSRIQEWWKACVM